MKFLWVMSLVAAAEAHKKCHNKDCFKAAKVNLEECSAFLRETLVPCSDSVDVTVTSTNTGDPLTRTFFTPVTTPTTLFETETSTSTTTLEKSATTTTTQTIVTVEVVTKTTTITVDPVITTFNVKRGIHPADGQPETPAPTPVGDGATCTAVVDKATELPSFATACGKYAGERVLSRRVSRACASAGVERETVTLAQGTLTVTRTAVEEFTPRVDVTRPVTTAKRITVTNTVIVPATASTTVTTITDTASTTLTIPTTTTTTTFVDPPMQTVCNNAQRAACVGNFCNIGLGDSRPVVYANVLTCPRAGKAPGEPVCRANADCPSNYICVFDGLGFCEGGNACARTQGVVCRGAP